MAQVSRVISGDPDTLTSELNTLAASEEILIITKTKSSGKFLVISDDAGATGQLAQVISGDPEYLAATVTTISASRTVEIVTDTFSAAYYVVVSV